MSKKILLLEDDAILATEIQHFLSQTGYNCEVCYDGQTVLESSLAVYDLFILDIDVPIIDGIKVCRKIRDNYKLAPILMLTAYGSVSDKVNAFNMGADDYLVKPFSFDELQVRIQALMRRYIVAEISAPTILQVSDLVVNLTDKTVKRAERIIDLTQKEFKLLELLMTAKGRVLSKQFIVSKVWDINFATGTNTVEVYINFLRTKIDKGFSVKLIHNRPGFGYYLKYHES